MPVMDTPSLEILRRSAPAGFDAIAQPYKEKLDAQPGPEEPSPVRTAGAPEAKPRTRGRQAPARAVEFPVDRAGRSVLSLAGRFGKVELECSAVVRSGSFVMVELPGRGFKWSPPEAEDEFDSMEASSSDGSLERARLLSIGAEFDKGPAGRILVFAVASED